MIASQHATAKAAVGPRLTSADGRFLQRKCACGGNGGRGGECKECRKKREAGILQRETGNSLSDRESEAPPIVDEVIQSSGQPLDRGTRAMMESRFGHDFSHVRIHVGSRAAESAQAVDALAYTVSQHVVFGSGKFSPSSKEGQALLAHELAHVVQQANLPKPGRGGRLLVGADNSVCEHEAHRVASAVTTADRSSEAPARVSSAPQSPIVARAPGEPSSKESEQKADQKAMRLAAFPAQAIMQWRTLSLNDQRIVLIRMTGMYGADFAAAFLPFARGEKKPNISTSVETTEPAALVARGFRFAGDRGGSPTWVHPSGQEVKVIGKAKDEEDTITACLESTEDGDECDACCDKIADEESRRKCKAACAMTK